MIISGKNINKKIKQLNFEAVSILLNNSLYDEKYKIKIKCVKCKKEYIYTVKTLMYKEIKCKCNTYSLKIKAISDKYKIDVQDYYYDNNSKKVYITYKCKQCGKIIRNRYDYIENSLICNECKNINKTIEIQNIVNDKYGNIYKINGVYTGYHSYINVTCLKCGYEYFITPANLIAGKRCINCSVKQSKACDIIDSYLDKNNIRYVKEFMFDDLKFKRNLRFDYAIFDKNNQIKLLIEYNGKQHYIDERWGDNFELCQKRDNIKIEYCKNNNINLLIIPYYDEKNIEQILKKYIL